jgi:subtilase family serine protease
MDHMQLVLKRGPKQEEAFKKVLVEQQDRSSPTYHRWLTPEQVGEFGPNDEDIERVTSWLASYGFHIDAIARGRTVIELSGTADQVQQAFHTTIHRYVLPDGTEHWANATDPQIPTAFVSVVAGVNTLHNFYKRSMSRVVGRFSKEKATGRIRAITPQFTFAGSCNGSGADCYALGPYDFATIYNVLPLWNGGINGTGQTIAIVSDSSINVSDVNAFRSLFGLSVNPPQIILTSYDPGLTGDEIEAVLDAEWSGAVATGATVDLVVSPSTNSTFGGDLSAEYIVDTMNPTPSVLSYSYGACELALGTSGNTFYNTLWTQAASEGITVVVATGDSGSAGCDSANASIKAAQPAQYGLAVNGLASTPYNVAVGGTDFDDFSNSGTYWNSSNLSTMQASAKGYIPEIAYDDSCTNSIIYTTLGFDGAETACNSSTAADDGVVVPAGGSGGVSSCTASDGQTASSCSGGYAKPSWQTGAGVPADGKRDLPDISLFAGDGTIQNFYVVCEADKDPGGASCNLDSPYQDFVGIGGTSASTQVFAGLVALIDQHEAGAQGNINPVLYSLASEQAGSSCNATASPASTCVFLDVTTGTNAEPCTKGSPNCTVSNSGDSIGVLSGYAAGTGYDLATGLGSVNAANLVSKIGPNFYLSSSNPVITISAPGGSGKMDVTAYGVNAYTGTINLACSGLPAGAACAFSPTSISFTSSTTSVPFAVTVSTTSSSLMPLEHPHHTFRPATTLALVLITSASVLLISVRRFEVSRAAVFVVLVLATCTSIVGCAGGSGGSNPSTTTATLLATGSTGTPISSMTFTVNIQ